MPYSQFTLPRVQEDFALTFVEDKDLFSQFPPREPDEGLAKTLEDNLPLAVAINTEKARSEMIVAPLLIELRKLFECKISLFSGVNFPVDEERGLTGACDFLISRSPEQFFIASPVVTIVEAKNDNVITGLGQCVAEMVAAQLFNERKSSDPTFIYGGVTTGSVWKFLKLEQTTVFIDVKEYHIENSARILGILSAMVEQKA
jgi:hypothetical protein